MIQKLSQLKQVIYDFKHSTSGLGVIQKIYSTTRYVCLTIRYKGETRHLYLGRGKGYEGAYVGSKIPPSPLRIQDRFLEYLRSHLKSLFLEDMTVHSTERLLIFHLSRSYIRQYFLFLWEGRHLLFIHHYKDQELNEWETFCSWSGHRKAYEEWPSEKLVELFYEVATPMQKSSLSSKEENPLPLPTIDDLLKDEGDKWKSSEDKKQLKFLKKKKQRIENDLHKTKVWKEILSFVQSPALDLASMKELVVGDYKISFKKEDHHFKRVDHVYTKIKKLKKGEEIQTQRLSEIEQQILLAESKAPTYHIDRRKIISPLWWSDQKDKTASLSKENLISSNESVVEFSLGDIKGAIGLSAKANDALRGQWASKEDLWFHLDGYTGAHAILKTDAVTDLNLDQLSWLGSAMAFYSKVELHLVPLIFTQIKYVKGIKGTAGLVKYSKQKYMAVPFIKDWEQQLKVTKK